jgi:hypothetical protein
MDMMTTQISALPFPTAADRLDRDGQQPRDPHERHHHEHAHPEHAPAPHDAAPEVNDHDKTIGLLLDVRA